MTVARPRGRPERAPAEFLALRLGLDWHPDGVTLFESRPGAGGSRYEALERFPFDEGPTDVG